MLHQFKIGTAWRKSLIVINRRGKNHPSGLMKMTVFIGNKFGIFQELIREENIWF